MASLLDPLIKSGVVPPESVFTADFAKKWGGASDKILLMPGPMWYAKDIFSGTLHVPAGEMTAATAPALESEPLVTGQVGGGPWVVSKHTKNKAAAVDFVKWARRRRRSSQRSMPSRRATRRTAPLAIVWLKTLNKDPYFAAPEGPAMKAAANSGLDGLEHGDVSGSARLVEHRRHAARRREVVELSAAGVGKGLAQNAQAAGYKVVSTGT